MDGSPTNTCARSLRQQLSSLAKASLALGFVLFGCGAFVLTGCGTEEKQPQPQQAPAASGVVEGPTRGSFTALQALQHFQALMKQEIALEKSEWTVAHGMLALDLSDQADRQLLPQLEKRLRANAKVRDKHGYGFRSNHAHDGREIGEGHPHVVLKTLAELELFPELRTQLLESALTYWRPPRFTAEYNDSAWLVEACARLFASEQKQPSPAQKAWAVKLLEQLENFDAPVEAALARIDAGKKFQRPSGAAPIEVAGTWALTCGGQHLLQGLLVCAQHGWYPETYRQRLAQRVEVLIRRARAEYQFRELEYERAIAARVSKTRARRETSIAQLKLLGHALETLARARDASLLDAKRLEDEARWIRQRLLRSIQLAANELDLLKLLPKLRKDVPLKWQRWFGDGCHALRGLQLWPQLKD